MDDEKAAELKGLLTRHGEQVLDDPARFESLLKDTSLSAPERAAVFGAMKLGIPQKLREQPGTEVPAAVIARLADRLSQEMALRPDAARAGVEIWARALGHDVPVSAPPPPSPPPPQSSSAPPSWAGTSAPGAATAGGTPLPPPGKKAAWFSTVWASKIETKEQAIQIVRTTSVFYFVVGGIQVLLALLNPYLLIDAVIFIGGGIVLRQFNSRIAAVVMLIDACVGVLFSLLGGGFPLLAALSVWAGVRATDATFKLNRQSMP
jgi:uncharacterized membrane protein